MRNLFALISIVWALAALGELLELAEPLDGTTHAVSFVAFLGMALLFLIVADVVRED